MPVGRGEAQLTSNEFLICIFQTRIIGTPTKIFNFQVYLKEMKTAY